MKTNANKESRRRPHLRGGCANRPRQPKQVLDVCAPALGLKKRWAILSADHRPRHAGSRGRVLALRRAAAGSIHVRSAVLVCGTARRRVGRPRDCLCLSCARLEDPASLV